MIRSMTTLDAALDCLPKVELHCHVEGTMRPDTLVDLARRNGVSLPTSDPTAETNVTCLRIADTDRAFGPSATSWWNFSRRTSAVRCSRYRTGRRMIGRSANARFAADPVA